MLYKHFEKNLDNLYNLELFNKKIDPVGVFYPTKYEPKVSFLIDYFHEKDIPLCVPRVVNNEHMVFKSVEDIKDPTLFENTHPYEGHKNPIKSLDTIIPKLVFVPMLGFNT